MITTDKGDILYISGRTGKYLEPAAGKANLNIFAMAREGLRFELSGAFARALRQDEAVALRGLKVGTNGGTADGRCPRPAAERAERATRTVIVVLHDVAEPPRRVAARKRRRTAVKLAELEESSSSLARGDSDDARGDADLAGGAQVDERGAAVDQ